MSVTPQNHSPAIASGSYCFLLLRANLAARRSIALTDEASTESQIFGSVWENIGGRRNSSIVVGSLALGGFNYVVLPPFIIEIYFCCCVCRVRFYSDFSVIFTLPLITTCQNLSDSSITHGPSFDHILCVTCVLWKNGLCSRFVHQISPCFLWTICHSMMHHFKISRLVIRPT